MAVTTIFQATLILIIGVLIGIVLNFGILMPLTAIQDGFVSSGVYDVPEQWDTRDDIDFFITLTHMCVYLVPILSLLHFIVVIVKALRYDTREDEQLDYGAGSERW